MRRLLCLAVLVTGLSACQHSSAPRRVANYDGRPAPTPSVDQCSLPVSERTGGWVCPP